MMSNIFESSTLNAIQASEELENDLLNVKDDILNEKIKEKNEKDKSRKFNYIAIISAALLFIVIISWFEYLRIYFEYQFVEEPQTKKLLKNKYQGQYYYALLSTFIVAVILWFVVYKKLI